VTSAPVERSERIDSIDVLRGVAVLGILVMNIQDFSMIAAAYSNPSVSGYYDGRDFWIWLASHLFFDQKFMTVFSLLFGAGVMLFTSRVEARGERSQALHFRRMGWLILFGIVHAYFIWSGDILYSYGMCGLWVYAFRHRSAKTLIVMGVLLMCVAPLIMVAAGTVLPEAAPEYFESMLDSEWAPTAEVIEAEHTATAAGWWEIVKHRAPRVFVTQTFLLFMWIVWRAGGLMLVGMGLYKFGVFSAQRSCRFYRMMLTLGLTLGVPLVLWGVWQNLAHRWDGHYSMFFGGEWNYAGSVFVTLAWVGAVMLWCRSGRFSPAIRRFAAVGRMAFSNYIGQSILCVAIFHGFGAWTFMQVDRTGQLLIVLAVWALQLIVSPLWLARFRFGPLEWLWRSLSYRQRQPFRV